MATLKEKMKTLTGFCSHCGTEIMDLTKRKRARILPNYREHEVQLSDGSLMRVGVCEKCKAGLSSGEHVQKTADKVLENHKIYWDANVDDRPDHNTQYRTLTVIDPNTDINKVRALRKRRHDEEKLSRELDEERREKERKEARKQDEKDEREEQKRQEKVEAAKEKKRQKAEALKAERKAAKDQFDKDFAQQEIENKRIEKAERAAGLRP